MGSSGLGCLVDAVELGRRRAGRRGDQRLRAAACRRKHSCHRTWVVPGALVGRVVSVYFRYLFELTGLPGLMVMKPTR